MIMPKNPKPVPFDINEVTDVIFGIHKNEDYYSMVSYRNFQAKALPEELKKTDKEPDLTTFDNLRKISFESLEKNAINKPKVKKLEK